MHTTLKTISRGLTVNCLSKKLNKVHPPSHIYLRLMATKYSETASTLQDNGASSDAQKCVDKQVSSVQPIARCQYFLAGKKRFCKMLPISSTQYCGLHLSLVQGESKDEYKRIPCPYDPSHSVYLRKLDQHLAKCNARPKPPPIYFEEGVNSGLAGYAPCLEETYKLTAFPEEYLKNLIARIEDVYYKHAVCIENGYLTHLSMKDEIASDKNGEPARKHLHQQASLISHIHQLIPNCHNLTFVEFGAGRGKLSHWVERSLSTSQSQSEFILVDRASFRHKVDLYHRSSDGPTFRRLFIDIEHLCLSKVDRMENDRSVVGYCKHLCGGATDLAMSCLMTTLGPPHAPPSDHTRPSALVMAPCCHHQCTWRAYVGKKFFETELNFSPVDFHAVTLMTSWRTCGLKPSEDKPQDSSLPIKEWSSTFMKGIGYKCKRLIDFGRVWWLRENGMKTRVLEYVPQDVTLENIVIVATPKI